MRFSSLLPLGLFVGPGLARGITSAEGAACLNIANNFTEFPFECSQPDLAYKCRCENMSFMGTVLLCIGDHTNDKQIVTKAHNYIIDVCHNQGQHKYSFTELDYILETARKYAIDYDPQLKIEVHSNNIDLDSLDGYRNGSFPTQSQSPLIDGKLKIPVNITPQYYNLSFQTVSTLMDQRTRSTKYGCILLGYWGVVMIIAVLQNLSLWCFPYFHHRCNSFKFMRWLNIHLICPQLFMTGFYPIRNTFPRKLTMEDSIELEKLGNDKDDQSNKILQHEQQFEVTQEQDKQSDETQELQHRQPPLKKSRKTEIKNILRPIVTRLPIRVHSIVIIIYIFLLFILCCINYEPYSPNNVFHCSKGYRFVAYADRTGIIGTIQLPLVYLFSSRNNFIMYPTGLSYRAFQVFHKWTSRIVFVLLTLHGAFYLAYIDVKGDYIHRWGLTKQGL
ncbi:unnamed protein product [Ambrosiozyma monospora]|uniref:Unnamed protein product n=1 Tax=Ambrosiozyma monospora TaxID=43982 RepID=A0A9W6YZ45_AMBMO|nr:unnamed protein product [Ambrosiozyma monospora]